jgi:toxin ParE1/3/4
MRLRWIPSAVSDLESINGYLIEHLPSRRQVTMRRIYDGLRSLSKTPYAGRPGQEPGTRELLFPPPPYIAVYQVEANVIVILRIFHGARNRH